ncbi:myelin transcription factor 1-like [Sardina pilchardus]|uniref:myelin transcription factor 1-like n=1 Tax=Sardina pilchardus TaxID=27697 RepID=UPI002E0FEAB3
MSLSLYLIRCVSFNRFEAAVCDESFEEEKGLLLEEGIHLLQEAQRRPDCTITLEGKRCCKATEKCTEFKDRNLSCNELGKITMKGESYTEKRGEEESEEDEGEEEEGEGGSEMNEREREGSSSHLHTDEETAAEEHAAAVQHNQQKKKKKKKKKKKCVLM